MATQNLRNLILVALALTFTPFTSAMAATDSNCVFKDLVSNEVCPAYSSARALEILGMGDETIIFVEKDAAEKDALKQAAKRDRTSVLASTRIEDSVLLDEIDEDDAMLLEREVQELSGARYELPTSRREITRLLGFPDGAEVAKEDWIQMLKVHVEMTLSLSANASQFLLEQLGLSSAPAETVTAETTVAKTPTDPSNPIVVETH